MKTGSVGKAASEVKTVSTPDKGGSADDADSTTEAVKDQSVSVDGPTEATSADTDLEGVGED